MPHLVEPLLWSCTMGTAGKSVRPSHWDFYIKEQRGESLEQPAHGSWQTEFILQCPNCNLSQELCLSADSSWGRILTGNTAGYRSAWFRPSNEVLFLAIKPSLSTPGNVLNHSSTCCEKSVPLLSDYKHWWQLLETVRPSYTWAKRHAGRDDYFHSKASTGFGDFLCYD